MLQGVITAVYMAAQLPANAYPHAFDIRNLRVNPKPPTPGGLNSVKKTALAILLAFTLASAASFAQVMIRVGPPPPVVERRGPPPGEGYIWIGGHQHYDNDHYVWTAGHYDRPPHNGARWVPSRYERRNGGYVEIEGHWR